ncbi:MAG: undecaprenyl-diphosphate phosphatase [Candidatus Berkelbacteria bacterium]|nr:undecaprenyl-diphosphate phosphatase [Candidatus Berkelbacteria bacterium]
MSIFHAFILGVIQGLSEFLPISSSAHLVVIPYIFNWHYQGLDFDVALHFGTAIAIIAFFWHDWVEVIDQAISPDKKKETKYPHNLFWILVISTIPAAIGGYFLDNLAQHAFRNELLIAGTLAFFGLFLWWADSITNGKEQVKDIGYMKGLVVGAAQILAIVPGVSRSGITTTAGLFLNMDRNSATRFSFLLATPTLLGAFLLTLKDYSWASINVPFIIAVITSAIVGYFAIKFLLRYIEKHGYSVFALYRVAIAIVVTVIYFIR